MAQPPKSRKKVAKGGTKKATKEDTRVFMVLKAVPPSALGLERGDMPFSLPLPPDLDSFLLGDRSPSVSSEGSSGSLPTGEREAQRKSAEERPEPPPQKKAYPAVAKGGNAPATKGNTPAASQTVAPPLHLGFSDKQLVQITQHRKVMERASRKAPDGASLTKLAAYPELLKSPGPRPAASPRRPRSGAQPPQERAPRDEALAELMGLTGLRPRPRGGEALAEDGRFLASAESRPRSRPIVNL